MRLGLIPEHVDVGPAHRWLEAQLPPDWGAQEVYDNHEVLMLHGQHVCHWRDPECARCVVLDLCPTGQARLGVEAAPPAFVAEAGRTDDGGTAGTPLAPSRRSAPQTSGALSFDFDAADAAGADPMAVHPHRDAGPAPERGDHNPAQAQNADQVGDEQTGAGTGHFPNPGDGDTGGASAYAHGTHGKGESREAMNDEVAVDSGDDPQFRRGGAGPDEAPDPKKFAQNSEGRMGGAGWGSEQVGGSAVDRRPPDNPKA